MWCVMHKIHDCDRQCNVCITKLSTSEVYQEEAGL